jgi:hypothetical protein
LNDGDNYTHVSFQKAIFNKAHLAVLTRLLIPANTTIIASSGSIAQNGGWTLNTTRIGTLAPTLESHTNDATLTVPITTTGGPIVVWYEQLDGNSGEATLTIDGNTVDTLNSGNPGTAGKCICTHNVIHGIGTTQTPLAARYTGYAAGTHDLVFTVTGATGTGMGFSFIGVGTTGTGIPTVTLLTGTVAMTATATSGLPVSYTSATPKVCTVSGSTVSLLALGNCGIMAHQAGNFEYYAAPAVGRNFHVTLATQTITFPAIATQTYGTTAELSATASSGLAVSFAATTTPVCTVSGNAVTLVATGTCTIKAMQPGNVDYSAAMPVSQSFTVSRATLPVITVTANNTARPYGASNPAFTYTITGLVNGDTSAVVSGTASLTTTATPTSAVGTYPITFSTEGLNASNYTFTYFNGILTVYSGTSPMVLGLSSSSATVGSTGFTLTVNGANFPSKSVVLWNGAVRATTYVSSTQLTAAISAADVAKERTNLVTVANPAPNPGTSSALPFVVMSATPVAKISGGSIAVAASGSGSHLLTLTGTDFVTGSTVDWNGASLKTTYVSPWQISAAITASDYRSLPAVVTVKNPAGNSPGFELR